MAEKMLDIIAICSLPTGTVVEIEMAGDPNRRYQVVANYKNTLGGFYLLYGIFLDGKVVRMPYREILTKGLPLVRRDYAPHIPQWRAGASKAPVAPEKKMTQAVKLYLSDQ